MNYSKNIINKANQLILKGSKQSLNDICVDLRNAEILKHLNKEKKEKQRLQEIREFNQL